MKIKNTAEVKKLSAEFVKAFEAKKDLMLKALEDITETKSEENGTFKFIISTESEDRHGEVVKQDGIDIKNFMKNPVLLADHNYSINSIAGKFTKVYTEGKKTFGEGIFAPSETGQSARKIYDAGFLNAVSVGFIPTKFDEKDYSIIEECELLEVSLVAVPAQAEALAVLDKKEIGAMFLNGMLKIETKQDEEEDPEAEPTKEEVEKVEEVIEEETKPKAKEEEVEKVEETELEKRLTGIETLLAKLVDFKEAVEEADPKKEEDPEAEPETPEAKAFAFKRAVQKASKQIDDALGLAKEI